MTPEQFAALQTKVATFPADATDWHIADTLSSPDVTLDRIRRDVPPGEVREVLITTGEWANVIVAAESFPASEQVRKACIIVRDVCLHSAGIYATKPQVVATTDMMLGVLVAGGIIAMATKNALMDLTLKHPSWAETIGLVSVTSRDVGLARGGK